MPSLDDHLSPRSLAEVALIISRVGPCLLDEGREPSAESRHTFWQSTRLLERRWTNCMTERDFDISRLEKLAVRIFLCETVTRLWSTILGGMGTRGGKDDMTRLARNAVSGINRIRCELLVQMLKIPDAHYDRLQTLDRLRRRSERWTDMLLGPVAVKSNCFEFACHQDRARDFGIEALQSDPDSGLHAYHHMVSAGLLLAFKLHLTQEPIEEPELLDLMHSMLGAIPRGSLHHDGTLRSSLERRIAAGRILLECRGTFELSNGYSEWTKTGSVQPQDGFQSNDPDDD